MKSSEQEVQPQDISPSDWLTTLLLSIFLGYFGVDRFYVGKIKTGVLKLLVSICSIGFLCWIWWIVDLIFIATGKFTDSQGRIIKQK